MKIVSAVLTVLYVILTLANLFQEDATGARFCVLMAMMWMIYLKLLQMEEGMK